MYTYVLLLNFIYMYYRPTLLLLTTTLIYSPRDQHRIFVLCFPIYMVNKISSIMGIVNSFPAKWQLILIAFLGSSLLYSREPRI